MTTIFIEIYYIKDEAFDQLNVLGFICDFKNKKGYPPTIKEIAKNFNTSPGTINKMLTILKRENYIKINYKIPRGITIIEKIINKGTIYLFNDTGLNTKWELILKYINNLN